MSNYEYYSEKLTFYEDNDFIVELEETDGLLYIHVTVDNWKPSVYKKMVALWREIYERAWWGGYESIFGVTWNKQFIDRFVDKYGKYHGKVWDSPTQKDYYVYEWVLHEPEWED